MDNREDRHGQSQMWNHANKSGQPTLRPLTDSGLKPLKPLKTMPGAQPQPTSDSRAYPTPAWQPVAQSPELREPVPAMQLARPGVAPIDHSQPYPTPAWQPTAQPQETNAPVPAMQPAQPGIVPRANPQPYPTPAWQPEEQNTERNPSVPIADSKDSAPHRRIWTQTRQQPGPQAQFAQASSPMAREPFAKDIPRAVSASTIVRREPRPVGTNPIPQSPPAAPPAMGEPVPAYGSEQVRRRRILTHQDRAPAADMPDITPAAQRMTPARLHSIPTDSGAAASIAAYDETTPVPPPADHAPASPIAAEPTATDLLDDDSGRFEAVNTAHLAEPLPVPTFGAAQPSPAPKPKKRRHPLRNTLFVVLILGAVAFALYQSGLGARLWQSIFPSSANSSIPSVFGQSPSEQGNAEKTIAPATQTEAPELRSASVDPAQGKAPTQLVFKLETNTATSAILLLTEQNATLHTTAYGTPRGDGLLWQVTADIQEPYTGKVRIFLRDETGAWSESTTTCSVDIQ